jgi:octopine/nopaline transport system ATP-binding protein
MEKKHPALVVKDLRKRFDLEEVLKGLSLDANEGDVISLLGASGSGKSTFLRCINLLEIPDNGSVTVRDETIHMAADRAGNPAPADMKQVAGLRAQLGIVFHEFQSLVTHDSGRQCG